MPKLIAPLLLSDDEYEQIQQLAAHNYAPEKIAVYLSVDKDLFLAHWYNPDSPIRHFYDKGQLVAEFDINQKQKLLAESGNITAAQIFLKEAEKTRIDNIRKQCLFGE